MSIKNWDLVDYSIYCYVRDLKTIRSSDDKNMNPDVHPNLVFVCKRKSMKCQDPNQRELRSKDIHKSYLLRISRKSFK